jgi:hypothetical protein
VLVPPSARKVTTRSLLFYDPEKGAEFNVPAGESCILVKTYDEACDFGLVDRSDKQSEWVIKTNLQRGYSVVWLRNKLRGVSQNDIEDAN